MAWRPPVGPDRTSPERSAIRRRTRPEHRRRPATVVLAAAHALRGNSTAALLRPTRLMPRRLARSAVVIGDAGDDLFRPATSTSPSGSISVRCRVPGDAPQPVVADAAARQTLDAGAMATGLEFATGRPSSCSSASPRRRAPPGGRWSRAGPRRSACHGRDLRDGWATTRVAGRGSRPARRPRGSWCRPARRTEAGRRPR